MIEWCGAGRGFTGLPRGLPSQLLPHGRCRPAHAGSWQSSRSLSGGHVLGKHLSASSLCSVQANPRSSRLEHAQAIRDTVRHPGTEQDRESEQTRSPVALRAVNERSPRPEAAHRLAQRLRAWGRAIKDGKTDIGRRTTNGRGFRELRREINIVVELSWNLGRHQPAADQQMLCDAVDWWLSGQQTEQPPDC